MKKTEMLLEWLEKIEKDGIPKKAVFKMVWGEAIKIIRNKITANESWETIEKYIKKSADTFSGPQEMAGPHAAKVIFNQVNGKIWNINKEHAKFLRKQNA